MTTAVTYTAVDTRDTMISVRIENGGGSGSSYWDCDGKLAQERQLPLRV
jgi:hypothetical protein